MDGRRGFAVVFGGLAAALLALSGPAASARAEPLECALESLPSFVAQGSLADAGSVADVVQLACSPEDAGRGATLDAGALFEACDGRLTWSLPFPFAPEPGPTFATTLDGDGRATVVLWGGPGCMPGETTISANIEGTTSAPMASFAVLSARRLSSRLRARPANEVEDPRSGSAATVLQVGFAAAYAGQVVSIGSRPLLTRCFAPPSLVWVGAAGQVVGEEAGSVELTLDAHGSAFVVALAGGSCASGGSELEATLVDPPFIAYAASFTVLPPRPIA